MTPRPVTVLTLTLAVSVGIGLYFAKYRVQDLEDRINDVNRQIAIEREALHVLRAEWSLLNNPTRIADLAVRHLHMTPITPEAIKKIGALPMRPPKPVAQADVDGLPDADADADVTANQVAGVSAIKTAHIQPMGGGQ